MNQLQYFIDETTPSRIIWMRISTITTPRPSVFFQALFSKKLFTFTFGTIFNNKVDCKFAEMWSRNIQLTNSMKMNVRSPIGKKKSKVPSPLHTSLVPVKVKAFLLIFCFSCPMTLHSFVNTARIAPIAIWMMKFCIELDHPNHTGEDHVVLGKRGCPSWT